MSEQPIHKKERNKVPNPDAGSAEKSTRAGVSDSRIVAKGIQQRVLGGYATHPPTQVPWPLSRGFRRQTEQSNDREREPKQGRQVH